MCNVLLDIILILIFEQIKRKTKKTKTGKREVNKIKYNIHYVHPKNTERPLNLVNRYTLRVKKEIFIKNRSIE